MRPVSKPLSPFLLIFIFVFSSFNVSSKDSDDWEVSFNTLTVRSIPKSLKLKCLNDSLARQWEGKAISIHYEDVEDSIIIRDGLGEKRITFNKSTELSISAADFSWRGNVYPIPLWMSILPPLLAIVIALAFREVFTALFLGLLVGTVIIAYYQGEALFPALGHGVLMIADTYLLAALFDKGHLSIVIFSMLIGAMVNLITRNGGMKGVVALLARYAKSPRSGQLITWLLGIAIFFDDYANTLVVGNTMRPVCDRLKISREKLSYIVDSTAAPVAAIAFVTTWIGAELSYIQDGINTIGLKESAYDIFINSLSFAFYPVFALGLIFFLVIKKRDFGPMYKAELKAREQSEIDEEGKNTFSNKLNELEVDERIKARWYNAVIPVAFVIFGTIGGLIFTGMDVHGWQEGKSFSGNLSGIIGQADSYKALLWASLSGVLVAVLLTVAQKILSLRDSVDSLINGFRTMLTAILILIMAWSLALVTQHLHTADFISRILVDIQLIPQLIPALTFILAALVAFSTGSSWGTMAILYPLILPSSWIICGEFSMEYESSMRIFFNVVSSVLAGSVLGDHCSPISDTTILSSLASSCNHIEHVRTQLPYALTAGLVAILLGSIPSAFGISSVILFPLGLLVLYSIVSLVGKKTDE